MLIFGTGLHAAPSSTDLSVFDFWVLGLGAAAGSLVFGISGFAFGLTASVIWLQVLSPLQVVPLVVICPLVMNLVTLPRIRRDINLTRLWPFALGSTLGVPLGVSLLGAINANELRAAIGVLLVGYSGYALMTPRLPLVLLPAGPGRVADTGVGLLGGLLGGVSGLSVVLPSVWIAMRGGSKAEQRGLLQSFGLYCHLLTLGAFATLIGMEAETFKALALCVPISVTGSLVGMRIFARLSPGGFQRAIIWIILAGGIGLLARAAR